MVKSRKKRSAAPVSRADWEAAALEALAAGGIHAVAIPAIARSLGVTKGSFYWHFSSFDDLIAAALTRWEESDRAALADLEAVGEPHRRLEALFREAVAARRAHGLFVSLSGSSVPAISATIRRVSERRLDFLTRTCGDLGFDAEQAGRRALLLYSAYVGLLHLMKESPFLSKKAAVDAYVQHAIETFIPRRRARKNKDRRDVAVFVGLTSTGRLSGDR